MKTAIDPQGLAIGELEDLWTLLSDGITEAGPERESLFLTKLAILLANELGDFQRVAECVKRAAVDQRPGAAG